LIATGFWGKRAYAIRLWEAVTAKTKLKKPGEGGLEVWRVGSFDDNLPTLTTL